jgi:catechol 2,3-dioxygenase-like lactoylglutathione lyase family enzyme
MVSALRQIAMFVPELRTAEAYYQELFAMELIGREALRNDGLWHTLPTDEGWDHAEAAGIALGMVALRSGALVLVLFPGDPQPGQLYMIGLNMFPDEIAGVRGRLPADAEVWQDEPEALTFRDRYMITWQIYATGAEFRSSGEAQGRWLDV